MNAIEPTTTIATWNNVFGESLTVGDYIIGALGSYGDDYDLAGFESEFRAAIDEALPEGVQLVGDEFYTAWSKRGDYTVEQLHEAIAGDEAGTGGIDFWALAAKFDRAADPNPTEVTIYEDNAGAVYIERARQAWALGPVTADLIGTAAANAEAWVNGEWEPSVSDGQTRTDVADLDMIATWTPTTGLVAERDHNGELVAGAGGADFLGDIASEGR